MSDPAEAAIQALLQQATEHSAAGRFPAAEAVLREALREMDARGWDLHPMRGFAYLRLRVDAMNRQRFAEALDPAQREVELLERYFGPEHPRLAEPLHALGFCHYKLSQWEPALRALERSAGICRKGGAPAEAALAQSVATLGKCFQRQNRNTEAESRYREVLAIHERNRVPPGERLDLLYHLGMAVNTQGRFAEAESYLAQALALFDSASGPRFPLEWMTLQGLVRATTALRRLPEAEAYARRAVTVVEAAIPQVHPARNAALSDLGRVLGQQGRQEEAVPILERALTEAEAAYGPQHPTVAASLHNLAGFQFGLGRLDLAASLEERAVALYERQPEVTRVGLASSLACLAMIRERQGHVAEALQLKARAQALGPPPSADATGTIAMPLPNDPA